MESRCDVHHRRQVVKVPVNSVVTYQEYLARRSNHTNLPVSRPAQSPCHAEAASSRYELSLCSRSSSTCLRRGGSTPGNYNAVFRSNVMGMGRRHLLVRHVWMVYTVDYKSRSEILNSNEGMFPHHIQFPYPKVKPFLPCSSPTTEQRFPLERHRYWIWWEVRKYGREYPSAARRSSTLDSVILFRQ